jgi:uncharacterized phage-associated protein
MPFQAKSIANYFLEKGRQEGIEISPMKIQKLVYFSHGWYLAANNEPLINEQIEAWAYGPVVPSLYKAFRQYGRDTITSPATEVIFPTGQTGILNAAFVPVPPPSDTGVTSFLDVIWDLYKDFSAIQLSNFTHAADTPWSKTWRHDLPNNTDIPTELIREYFHEQLENN